MFSQRYVFGEMKRKCSSLRDIKVTSTLFCNRTLRSKSVGNIGGIPRSFVSAANTLMNRSISSNQSFGSLSTLPLQQSTFDNFGISLTKNRTKNLTRFYSASSSLCGKSPSNELLCVHVFVDVKPGMEESFKSATVLNASASAKEPGIVRFDVVQQEDDHTKFILIEVYNNITAPAEHKTTDHYLKWRETVENMMAVPRSAIKFKNIFPSSIAGWDYNDDNVV